MFITNELNPGEMIAEFFKGRRVEGKATRAFSDLRHDKDLCPRFARQINLILDVYKAYGHEVHDIQSMRDDGIDVLIRYEDRSGTERLAGLQIKSEDEFRKWEKKALPLLQILKAQHTTAISNVRLDEFYVLLCVDSIRHRSRIRMLCSDLKNVRPCVVVEPVDLLDFYQMSSVDVWARATRLLCHNDTVLKAAIDEADAEEPDAVYFLVSLMCRALESAYAVDEIDFFGWWSNWIAFADLPDESTERVAVILGELANIGILEYQNGSYTIQIGSLPIGLCALYFDLRVRFPGTLDEIKDQILKLIDLKGRLID